VSLRFVLRCANGVCSLISPCDGDDFLERIDGIGDGYGTA
jgi:hypothetical protein